MAKRTEPCDKCRITRHKDPIRVRLTRLECEDKSLCGKPCKVHANGIDRFPSVSTQGPPNFNNMAYATDCQNCLKIIREKDRQIYDKEVEMIKMINNLLTLPKTNKKEGTEADIEHDYKGLRDIEHELLKRERELARMRVEACDDICFNALRQKQLEIRWKDLELERQRSLMPKFVKKIKTKVRRMKEHNCFKELQKKEKELMQREADINEEIEEFREKQFEEELAALKAELEFRRRPFVVDANVDCSCDCAIINDLQEREKECNDKLARDACHYMPIGAYIPFWTSDTMELINGTRFCLAKMARQTPCPKNKADRKRLC